MLFMNTNNYYNSKQYSNINIIRQFRIAKVFNNFQKNLTRIQILN